MSCVFCRIAARREFAIYAKWWPEVVAFHPLNPVTEGHMLFIPFQHVSAAHVNPEVTGSVMQAAAEWAHADQVVAAQMEREQVSYNLITSCGAPATQTINHLHIHYVPRFAGDGLALPWTGQTKEKEQEA